MQGDREKSRDETEGSGQQQPVGQDSPENEYGEIGKSEPCDSSEPRSIGEGRSKNQEQGFILEQGRGPIDDQQERGSSPRATDANDFAPEGRGALEGEQEDVEGGQSRAPGSDIEQH